MSVNTSSNRQSAVSVTDPASIRPGDQILVSVPAGVEDIDKEIWGWVLEKKCIAEEVWIVIDHGMVMHRNPAFSSNNVIKVNRASARLMVPRNKSSPVLLITTSEEDDMIIGMRRIDGKMSSLNVLIDRGGDVARYEVDYRYWSRMT